MTVNYVNEYTFSERSMRQKRGLFHEGTEEKCCGIVKLIPGSPAGSRRGFDRIGRCRRGGKARQQGSGDLSATSVRIAERISSTENSSPLK